MVSNTIIINYSPVRFCYSTETRHTRIRRYENAFLAALRCREAAEGLTPAGHVLAGLARKRKWQWPSRQDARRALGSKPPFNAWNSKSMDAFIQHALKPLVASTARADEAAAEASPLPSASESRTSDRQEPCNDTQFTQSRTSHRGRSNIGQGRNQQHHHDGRHDSFTSTPVQLCCSPAVETAVYLACEPPPQFDAAAVRCPVAWAITCSDPGLHSRLPKLGRCGVQELPHACLRE